jgi:hypothetical protein
VDPDLPSKPAARLPSSAVFLILANLIPLIGALAWGWSILEIVAVYWAENLVIGLFTIFRLFTVATPDVETGAIRAKIAISVFFILHYGLFCLVHGVFVFALLGDSNEINSPTANLAIFAGPLKWAILALAVSHGFSFFANYLGRGENLASSILEQIAAPYPRIIVLHLAILLGAFAVQALGSPVFLLATLVIGKTLLDLKLHRLAHHRKATVEKPGAASYAREWASRWKK